MVPIVDPDSAIDINTLWDNMVTKPVVPTQAAATSTVDFDWDTADAGPDTEPGEVDVNELLGLLDPTKQIFPPTLEWMSFAKGNPISVAAATPDTYTPRSFKTFRSTRRLRGDGSSYALLAVSSPSLDREQVTETIDASASAWAILENIKNVMNDMWKAQVGLMDVGAEGPYSDISAKIADLVAPAPINPSASLLDPMQYTCFCIADWVLEIPDTTIPSTLDANAG